MPAAAVTGRGSRGRLTRVALLTITGVLLVLAAWELALTLPADVAAGHPGQDQAFYASLGRRWVDTGVLYGDRQLTGQPYHVIIDDDNLYPPPAIVLFAPFAFLPAIVWWLIPLGVVVYGFWRWRPSLWVYAYLAFVLFWPRTQGSILFGNTDLWSTAFVAGGLLWGWPGPFGFIKPAFGPLGFAGVPRRSWWVGAAVLAAISLALWSYWPQYVVAATHWDLPLTRSIANVPLPLLPFVAWLGRTRPAPVSLGRLKRSSATSHGALLLICLLVAGCGLLPDHSAPTRVALPAHAAELSPPADSFRGTLLNRGSCFYLQASDGREVLPIWPPGFYGELWPGGAAPPSAYVLRDAEAGKDAFARVGEILEVRGTYGRNNLDEMHVPLLHAPDAECVTRPFFVVDQATNRS